jgi:hypothetical protein
MEADRLTYSVEETKVLLEVARDLVYTKPSRDSIKRLLTKALREEKANGRTYDKAKLRDFLFRFYNV